MTNYSTTATLVTLVYQTMLLVVALDLVNLGLTMMDRPMAVEVPKENVLPMMPDLMMGEGGYLQSQPPHLLLHKRSNVENVTVSMPNDHDYVKSFYSKVYKNRSMVYNPRLVH